MFIIKLKCHGFSLYTHYSHIIFSWDIIVSSNMLGISVWMYQIINNNNNNYECYCNKIRL